MNLEISKFARPTIDNSIIISGAARTGTTIFGRLIGSFKNTEYSFEPPFLISLLSKINSIKKNNWKLLFETYLYEDIFLGSLSGRLINTNLVDDSSVFKIKSNKEIKNRLNKSVSKLNLEKKALKYKLALKVLDMPILLEEFVKYYPKTKIVIIKRDPFDTINSLFKKKWFNESNNDNNQIWPFYIIRKKKIPYWVPKKDAGMWLDLDEINKCAYYYILNYKKKHKKAQYYSYEKMISNPNQFSEKLSKDLNLKYGTRTKKIIKSIKKNNNNNKAIIKKISKELIVNLKF